MEITSAVELKKLELQEREKEQEVELCLKELEFKECELAIPLKIRELEPLLLQLVDVQSLM